MENTETPNGGLSALNDELCVRKFVTVVYEIVDDKEWRKTNPLHYQHNGLKATTASVGDLASKIDLFEELCREHDIDIPFDIYDV